MKRSPAFFESIGSVTIASEQHDVIISDEIDPDEKEKELGLKLDGTYNLERREIELSTNAINNDIYNGIEILFHEMAHGYVLDYELETLFGIDGEKLERIADALINIVAKIQKKFMIENTELASKIISLIKRRKKHGEKE